MKVGYGFQWFPGVEGEPAWSRHQFLCFDLAWSFRGITFDAEDVYGLVKRGVITPEAGVPDANLIFHRETKSLEIMVKASEGEKGYAVEANVSEMEIWVQQIISSLEAQLEELANKTLDFLEVMERVVGEERSA